MIDQEILNFAQKIEQEMNEKCDIIGIEKEPDWIQKHFVEAYNIAPEIADDHYKIYLSNYRLKKKNTNK